MIKIFSKKQPLPDPAIAEALRLLGKDKLMLSIHDTSFPSVKNENTGRGSPYSQGGRNFLRFAHNIGFNAIQLGPQGQTSRINASPYDGTIFSRNFLSLDLHALAFDSQWSGWLSKASFERIVASNPYPDGSRTHYAHAFKSYKHAVNEIYQRFNRDRDSGAPNALRVSEELADLWRTNKWLQDDALYEALCVEHGDRHWHDWPDTAESKYDKILCAPPQGVESACDQRRRNLETKHKATIERHTLIQYILLQQHQAFRNSAENLGIKLFGDVQIGLSSRDTWSQQDLLLKNYLMGAPPSRTNPEGQPWGYGVLDPDQYLTPHGSIGPALTFISERFGKMLSEFDGLRIDHPHGLICPWVYRSDDPDPFHAVQNGGRLFSSPNLPDHPELERYAIVAPVQINATRPRFADDWVSELTPHQEARYSLVLTALIQKAHKYGRQRDDILCEVLSTQPYPLERVMQRHGLGRFRVTQKAILSDPNDVYRSENAGEHDWVMVGNHDTPSIWQLAKKWHDNDDGLAQAEYLAQKLSPHAPEEFAALLASDPHKLVHAKVADLFLSPARQVMMFFSDLLGIEENYNVPGTMNDENWTLRVPTDYKQQYESNIRLGKALNLPCVLAMALRANPELAHTQSELISQLDDLAGWRIDY